MRAKCGYLPEVDKVAEWEYRDTGCEVSPSCLSCPLPVCKYDLPGGVPAVQRLARDIEIVQLAQDGRSVALIAKKFGMSERSVFRIVAAGDPRLRKVGLNEWLREQQRKRKRE